MTRDPMPPLVREARRALERLSRLAESRAERADVDAADAPGDAQLEAEAQRLHEDAYRWSLPLAALEAAGGDEESAQALLLCSRIYQRKPVTCLRCGYSWVPELPGRPTACAQCRHRGWDTAPGSVKRGRPRNAKPAA